MFIFSVVTIVVAVVVVATLFCIEIDKERMASSKLTREIVYEKKAAKYEGVGRFDHKLRQFYEFFSFFKNHHR